MCPNGGPGNCFLKTHTGRSPGSLGEPGAAPTVNTLILPHTSHEEAARQKDAGCAPDKAPSRTAGVETPDFHLNPHGNKTAVVVLGFFGSKVFHLRVFDHLNLSESPQASHLASRAIERETESTKNSSGKSANKRRVMRSGDNRCHRV